MGTSGTSTHREFTVESLKMVSSTCPQERKKGVKMADDNRELADILSVLNDALQVALLRVELAIQQHAEADSAQLQDAVSRAARAAHDLRLMTQPDGDAQWSQSNHARFARLSASHADMIEDGVRQTEDAMRFTQTVAADSPGEFEVERFRRSMAERLSKWKARRDFTVQAPQAKGAASMAENRSADVRSDYVLSR